MAQLVGGGANNNVHRPPFGTDGNPVQYKKPVVNANETGEQLLKRFREKIKSRGSSSIFKLGRMFRNVDDDNSHKIDQEEFTKCLKEFRLGMSEEQMRGLYGIFDRNGDGVVDYDEFIRGVVGQMNSNR